MTDKFDCVYRICDDGEEIPYCQRLETREQLNRNRQKCENQGVRFFFRDLLNRSIEPKEVLRWSSSIEMADLYATIFYNRTLIEIDDNQFVCNCTRRGSFGKYCEYQLTHHAEAFSEVIQAQFEQKRAGDSWNTQRYGKILCYKTLPCFPDNICLDWRDICDGVQRCSSGIDEENWDKLEFNECEDDEFRCTNGMCIPHEFWLDGDLDCMDWSDELRINPTNSCPFNPDAFECDEHVCSRIEYSCGDGQCISWSDRLAFQKFIPPQEECFSKRHLNYMCESSPNQHAWTLDNGLCWPDKGYDDPRYPPWYMINSSTLTDDERCQYLFRCILSDGLEHDCPCNRHNCTEIMINVGCKGATYISYPSLGIINAHSLFIFDIRRYMIDSNVHILGLHGNIQCRGFQIIQKSDGFDTVSPLHAAVQFPSINELLCAFDMTEWKWKDHLSRFQRDKSCWNSSKTFNGRPYAVNPETCSLAKECISQYRIHDGTEDCIDVYDELTVFESDFCTGNVGRHRFQCYSDQHACLPLNRIAIGTTDCSNNYDEMFYGGSVSISYVPLCKKGNTDSCHLIKEYIIQSSSIMNATVNSSIINITEQIPAAVTPFRLYCNSFWDRSDHSDESPSFCQHWTCLKDQFRCKTGQCIDLSWVCDGVWDCSDASDEEAIVLMQPWIGPNARLPEKALNNRSKECQYRYRSSQSPFSKICNTSYQFGCYLTGVSNPLDIRSNHPSINLTQIGDLIEDCYNAYDERNTFASNSSRRSMWGWNIRCGSDIKTYYQACLPNRETNCSVILCSIYRDIDGSCSDIKDVICLEDNQCKKNVRCNGILDCKYGEDEYWCAPGTSMNQLYYRKDKHDYYTKNVVFNLPQFPSVATARTTPNPLEISDVNITQKENSSFVVHSYQCHRGLLFLNQTKQDVSVHLLTMAIGVNSLVIESLSLYLSIKSHCST